MQKNKINKYEKDLRRYLINELNKLDFIEVYNKDVDTNIVAFNIKGVFAQDTAIYLDKYNICVRAGNHCAKILDNVFNISNTVRISLSFYNNKEEIDLLINVLKNSSNMEGNIIMDRDLKRSIILDNYQNPNMKHTSNEDYVKINTRNVSCIDNLDIYLKIEDNIIRDISFEGEACVISISSTNILANMLVGKSKEEGIYLIDNYLKMINEEEYDKDVLKELLVFDDTSKQPSRIKCATLSANGIKDYLEEENHS